MFYMVSQMELKECMKYLSGPVYHGENVYTHSDFYNVVGSEGIDLFFDIWGGKLLIPCEYGLCEWKGEAVFTWQMLCEKTIDSYWDSFYVCTKAEALTYLQMAILEKKGINFDDEEPECLEGIIEEFLDSEKLDGISYLFTSSGGRYI